MSWASRPRDLKIFHLYFNSLSFVNADLLTVFLLPNDKFDNANLCVIGWEYLAKEELENLAAKVFLRVSLRYPVCDSNSDAQEV